MGIVQKDTERIMKLIYIYNACWRENKTDAQELLASKEPVCPQWRHKFSQMASKKDTKSMGCIVQPLQERAACYRDLAKAVLFFADAGCSKTITLIARVLYLHQALHVFA